MNYYIKADQFMLEDRMLEAGYLAITDGRFGEWSSSLPEEAEVVDWSGYTIAPGLFDTHIHGINGYDVMDGTKEAVHHISKALLSLGVTRFLPTTLTSSTDALEQAISATVEATNEGLLGALSEGIYLEGPFFTERYKGAQNPKYFRDPDIDLFQQWQQLANYTIVKIALAPERKAAIDFIKELSDCNILVSIGHSDASYDCSKRAIQAGARNFVHLFNGMSGLHHRNPGVAGTALMTNDTFAELICDSHHVHPDVANFAWQVKGEKIVLITDCMRAGLMPDGHYYLGEFPVVMQDGTARTETGSLAGSTLKLIDGVKHLQSWSHRPLHEVWHLASLSPAKSLGRGHELGSIHPGKYADYVVVDNELMIHATAVNGEVKFQRKATE
ncbi:N-acetylglucosamine-6-phosphate deacetylase [Virgibacillus proomii]|uniref:N-acetylglucosamine-6-phosphate deacetylase n=1 Tax=Virgibacillus proomii TaxID=84407 RepID=UPI001C110D6D|nr:N-acetylglucosamine-6-phosphate deacetylase [Virgibacillus proomii]MBU5268096.1 N-acetylglucosamine-6-phosphate deacetylase [Virgibacillus proomii]